LVVLGVDPGARAAGYGLLEGEGTTWRHRASGVIRPPAGKPLAARLAALDLAIRDLVARHQPAEVAVEGIFYARNPRSAIVMGHARGVILLAAGTTGAVVAEYAPREIKMSVTGSGAASKQQVREMVMHLITSAPPRMSLDAADALAVALCHINRRASFVGARGAGTRGAPAGGAPAGGAAAGGAPAGLGSR